MRRTAAGLGLLVAAAAAPLLVRSEYVIGTLTLMCFFAFVGQGWNILGGYAGQFSFGHALFFGIGAYTSSLCFLKAGLTPWVGMWLGAAAAVLVGLVTGHLSFRYGLRGAYFALVMLAVAEIFRVAATNWDYVGGSFGILVPLQGHAPRLFQFGDKRHFYYVILAMLLAVTWGVARLERSRLGYQMIAIRENEAAADALGIDPYRVKLAAMALSAAITALGGAFYAQYFSYVDPTIGFGPGNSIEILLRPIIGGAGTLWGPLLGAVLLGLLGESTRGLVRSYAGLHLMLYGVILMGAVVFLPRGVMGALRSLGGGAGERARA
ncbi:MAG: branched-chain amino acid ABC transporter permease [Candidatus Rokubacteria bacterium]|nr:branched-chain amino acid ABC transporter permease [Candidatus Rokubacteria bacterium]MBI2525866.1 branched-chain amino acid ABC transporter permease [Candidatus Rokubacteria bacterium]